MRQHESNMVDLMGQSDFATNGIDGEAMLMNAQSSFATEWRLGYNNIIGCGDFC